MCVCVCVSLHMNILVLTDQQRPAFISFVRTLDVVCKTYQEQ